MKEHDRHNLVMVIGNAFLSVAFSFLSGLATAQRTIPHAIVFGICAIGYGTLAILYAYERD